MNAKNTYRIIDSKGRVLIPKDMRSASGLDYGDIVKLNVHSEGGAYRGRRPVT